MEKFQQYYERLNYQQKKAVDVLDGPLLVLAGPGTGKTQLLSVRTANIIHEKKVDPENILILTFTNAAARAMRERLADIIGHPGYDVDVETFHSFANSIVLESEDAIKYVKNKIEMSEVEKIRAIEYILDNVKGAAFLRPFGSPYIHRGDIEKAISELKNEGISPLEFSRQVKVLKPNGIDLEEKVIGRLKALSVIYDKYEKLKDSESDTLFDERGRRDFDDMIFIALEALEGDPDLSAAFQKQYKYIMVDEFQDTNGAQLRLLFSILDPSTDNICCVGDDDQSIFRFQGASLSNFRILKEKFKGLTTVALQDNYRSTKGIIDLGGDIISQLDPSERIGEKALRSCVDYPSGEIKMLEFLTEEEEMAFLVDEIEKQKEKIEKDMSLTEEQRDKPYDNIAVLLRKRRQINKVIDACLRAGIPYATDGKEDMRQEKRVRQMLDALEVAHVDVNDCEEKSLALYKVLSADYIQASQTDILKIIGYINRKKRKTAKNEKKQDGKRSSVTDLYREFMGQFPVNMDSPPEVKDSKNLPITKELDLCDPHALHCASWAILRMLSEAGTAPVHDILLQYIEDTSLYRFILKSYGNEEIMRKRDLRSLVSFINMVKNASLSRPGLRLSDLMKELELRDVHGLAITGEMATLSQEGVRIYTAHASKGLEFQSVFLPFCLDKKSWPARGKPQIISLPAEIYKSKEKVEEKNKLKLLRMYDELRLFYVAATRAKSDLFYTATPSEKNVISQFFCNMRIKPVMKRNSGEEEFLVNFLKNRVDARDSMEDTEKILKDLVGNITLNPTSLGTYLACRRKFLYNDVLRLPGKKNQHLAFGNCVHQALEDVYTGFMDHKTFPSFDFFKESFKRELFYEGVNDSVRNWCLDRLESLDDWYKAEEKAPIMPIEIEKKFEMTFPEGFSFTGKFDKIEVVEDNLVRVVDYKTGKPDKHVKAIHNFREIADPGCDNYYRQLIAYKLLYDKNHRGEKNRVVSSGKLQFLEPAGGTVKKYGLEKGRYKDIDMEITDEMVKELEKVISNAWKDIQALKFERLSERDEKERCRNCAYDSICWG